MTVVGPFTRSEWETLKMLRKSIDYMKSLNRAEYQEAIAKEKRIYRGMMKEAA